MSENIINKVFCNMGYDMKQDICGYGFCMLVCSVLIELGLWLEDVVEFQMSYKESNSVCVVYIYKVKYFDQC